MTNKSRWSILLKKFSPITCVFFNNYHYVDGIADNWESECGCLKIITVKFSKFKKFINL